MPKVRMRGIKGGGKVGEEVIRVHMHELILILAVQTVLGPAVPQAPPRDPAPSKICAVPLAMVRPGLAPPERMLVVPGRSQRFHVKEVRVPAPSCDDGRR